MKSADFYARLDRAALEDALQRAGSPCYLFYLPLLREKVQALRAALPDAFSLLFAVKANPHPEILKALAALGVGADVASQGELAAALAAGVPAQAVSFSGPGKTRAELSAAIDAGIGAVNVESKDELQLLLELSARAAAAPVQVGVRLNSPRLLLRGGLRMAGGTQFGMSEQEALACVRILATAGHQARFCGLHVHAGSQLLEASAVVAGIKSVLDIAMDLEQASGVRIDSLNFGGGLGVDYFANEAPLDLSLLARELAELLQAEPYRSWLPGRRLLLEPGRFLVAECGVYATRVLYRKRSGKKEFAIVDGGLHHSYVLAGGMGQVIRRNFALDILPPPGAARAPCELRLDIAGRLCTPQDILAHGVQAAHDVAPGDCVVFFNCGAYGASASPQAFLSHPPPDFVFLRG